MKAEELTLTDLEHFSIVKLTHIYLLSMRLDSFISQETQKLKDRKEKLGEHKLIQLPNLMDKAYTEGIICGKDYMKLKEEDPERYKTIFEQSGLLLSKTMLETENILFGNIFPTITWSSLFLISMSHLEYSLILICNYFTEIKKIKLKLSDLNGNSTYEKFILFISKVVEMKYLFEESTFWQKIKNHQKVRNLLIHNNGLIDDTVRAKVVKKIIRDGHINLKWNNNMILLFTQEYLEDVINDCQDWMQEFFNKLK